MTDIDMMFNTQIRYLRFYNWFYNHNVFPIALLVWSGICTLYFILRPSDKTEFLK